VAADESSATCHDRKRLGRHAAFVDFIVRTLK